MAASSAPTFVNDFVGLPIIISDFDALTNNSTASEVPSQTPATQSAASSPTTYQPSTSSSVATAYSSGTVSAAQQNWNTGFADFADELWAKMTQGMKQKLRDACVEVLRKTEDVESTEHMSWQYDDDARFLD